MQVVRILVAEAGAGGWFNAAAASLARPHPLLPGHVSVVDERGRLHVVRLGEDGARSTVVAAYELHLAPTGPGSAPPQPVRKAWAAFEHLADDGLLLAQAGSGRILFAQLPPAEGEAGAVFAFGAHDAPVLALASTRSLLASGGADGCVRLWGLDSGQGLDAARAAGAPGVQVTALVFAGPLMLATGTDQGDVCMYDISSARLEAVQRFRADAGPVTALAAGIAPVLAAGAATATAPRGRDGGGVVAGPGGMPWRGPDPATPGGTDALLAVASPAGWLHVYRAAGFGEAAWAHVHAGAVAGRPHLAFSPDGAYLAVGAGLPNGRLSVLSAQTMQLVLEQPYPGPLAGAGFLAPAAGGSQLVALARGGSLAGGVRLRLYTAPEGGLPELVQLTMPLSDGSNPAPLLQAGEDEAFLAWLHTRSTASPQAPLMEAPGQVPSARGRELTNAPLPPSPLAPVRGGPADPPGTAAAAPAWDRAPGPTDGWLSHFLNASSPAQADAGYRPGPGLGPGPVRGWLGTFTGRPSPSGSGGDGGGHDGGYPGEQRSPSVEPWASDTEAASPGPGLGLGPNLGLGLDVSSGAWGPSPSSGGGGFGGPAQGGSAGGAPGPGASPARTWQAARPSTQPAPRSWLTGLPPRADFLPQPVSASPAPPAPAPVPAPPGAPSPEPELPSSGTLLPASGLGFCGANTGRHAPQPHARAGRPTPGAEGTIAEGDAGEQAGGAGAGSADWRADDLLMGTGFRAASALPNPASRGPATSSRPHPAAPAPAAGPGPAGSSAHASWSGSLASWQRWAPQQPLQPQPQPHAPGDLAHEHGAAAGGPGAEAGEEGAGTQGVDRGYGLEGGFEGEEGDQGGFEGAGDSLERTAYLGARLAALGLGRDGGDGEEGGRGEDSGAGGAEVGWRLPTVNEGVEEVEEQEQEVEEEEQPRQQQPWQQSPGAREPQPFGAEVEAAGEGAEVHEEEGEELRPRGPGMLPAPRQAGGPSGGGAASPPSLSPPGWQDGRQSGQQGQEAGAEAAWEEEGAGEGVAESGAGAAEGPGGEWNGWAYEELLSTAPPPPRAIKAAAKGPAPRPAAAPRQPPTAASHRLRLSEAPPGPHGATAALRSAAAAGPGPRTLAQRYAPLDESAELQGWAREAEVETTPAPSVGGRSPARSLLQSPEVLRGSPSAAASAAASTSAAAYRSGPGTAAPTARPIPATAAWRKRPAAGPPRSGLPTATQGARRPGGPSAPPADDGADAAGSSAGPGGAAAAGGGGARRNLLALRQRQQQRLRQQLGKHAPAPSAALEHAPPSASEVHQSADQTPLLPPAVCDSPWALPSGPAADPDASSSYADPDASASSALALAPAGRVPPYAPQFGSTALLLKRMQALGAAVTAPPPRVPVVGPGSVGGGGAPGSPGRALAAAAAAAGMGEAALEEAARRAATAAANVPWGAEVYHGLPPVDYVPPQPPKLSKQLHPGWLASRTARPELRALWRPEERLAEVCNTRGVALYTPPSPAGVAAGLLSMAF
ncbi:hypothetical protein HYH03_015659 [Edaphochlamys debaryana]|uniref:Uncharacterized protein n=1 Tax=Edaphochlamys debaryana TaxID=47281 RepID=A0A835XLF8_9CHLO|nr:hypothetical protein HYH03_015659 [Edaphochlamys debaryana]|eukprot:KAG2485595.1 hypothetical protein HYH03_015659 [Edaphochlamys debaryana]